MRAILVMLLVATPALAAPDTRAFLRYCETKAPVATCGCVVNELSRTRNGQIAIDAYRVTTLPPADQQAAAVALANKYGARLSEIKAAIEASNLTLRDVTERCV